MKFLVTGATGLLGNNLVRWLLQENHEVRVLCRPPSERPELGDLNIHVVSGDVTNPADCEKAVIGVDHIVHCAGLIHLGWRRMDESRRINVDGTVNLAKAALKNSQRFVLVSSVDALAPGDRDHPADESSLEPSKTKCAYVVSKREADQRVLNMVQQGLDVSIVHPGLMFGAFDWKPSSGQMIVAIANGFMPFAPPGGITVLDVQDACRGILAAATKGKRGERFILGGRNMTYFELWKLIATQLGRPKPWARVGPVNAWLAGLFGDIRTRLTNTEGPVNSAGISMSKYFNYYSSDKAKKELAYEISPIEPALDRAIEFFKRQKMIK